MTTEQMPHPPGCVKRRRVFPSLSLPRAKTRPLLSMPPQVTVVSSPEIRKPTTSCAPSGDVNRTPAAPWPGNNSTFGNVSSLPWRWGIKTAKNRVDRAGAAVLAVRCHVFNQRPLVDSGSGSYLSVCVKSTLSGNNK